MHTYNIKTDCDNEQWDDLNFESKRKSKNQKYSNGSGSTCKSISSKFTDFVEVEIPECFKVLLANVAITKIRNVEKVISISTDSVMLQGINDNSFLCVKFFLDDQKGRESASREYKFMKRLVNHQILCLSPLEKRDNFLSMHTSGLNKQLQTLVDLTASREEWIKIFIEVKKTMSRMFHEAQISHGNLNPENIIWDKGRCCIFNLSNSVDADSESGKSFLRKDCNSISAFFKRHNVESDPLKLYEEVLGNNLNKN